MREGLNARLPLFKPKKLVLNKILKHFIQVYIKSRKSIIQRTSDLI